MSRSVSLLLAAAALTLHAGQTDLNTIDARTCAAKVAAEAGTLASMATMQHLDYRSHQIQLEIVRAEVNELGIALGESPRGPLADKAREVASLLSQSIEILNQSQNAILPIAYRQTAKKLESAAEQLLLEARRVRFAPDSPR